MLPEWLLAREELTPGAKIVFAVLIGYGGAAGEAWPGQDRMAVDCGIPVRTVQRHISELEAVGLIEIERCGKTKTNRYFFLWHEWIGPEVTRQNGITVTRQNGGSRHAKMAGCTRQNGGSHHVRERREVPEVNRGHVVLADDGAPKCHPTPPIKAPPPDFGPDCDRILAAYPKRSGDRGLGPGREKLLQLLKSGEDPEEILAGVLRYAACEEAEGNIGTRFIKRVVTFLNQRSWKEKFEPSVAPRAESANGSRPTLAQQRDALLEEMRREDAERRDAEGSFGVLALDEQDDG